MPDFAFRVIAGLLALALLIIAVIAWRRSS